MCKYDHCRVKAKLQETSPERVDPFMANAPAEVKKILGNIKNFQVCFWSRSPSQVLPLCNEVAAPSETYDDDILRTPLEVMANETNLYSEYAFWWACQTCPLHQYEIFRTDHE